MIYLQINDIRLRVIGFGPQPKKTNVTKGPVKEQNDPEVPATPVILMFQRFLHRNVSSSVQREAVDMS